MIASLPAILLLGLLLGMRHATDADHVVALTTIVARERAARAAMRIGALWGLGHSVTILLVGGAIVLSGAVVPPRLGLAMEMVVGAMLILLGALNLAGRRTATLHRHDHSPPRRAGGLRPLVVGIVHGLSGSAAIALLVLTTIRTTGWALVYLAVFGAGTVLGMMTLTTAMMVPLVTISRRFQALDGTVARLTGAISLAFGLFVVYRIGIADGLFAATPHWTPN